MRLTWLATVTCWVGAPAVASGEVAGPGLAASVESEVAPATDPTPVLTPALTDEAPRSPAPTAEAAPRAYPAPRAPIRPTTKRVGQHAQVLNTFYLELLGQAGVYSLNYELRVVNMAVRVGFSGIGRYRIFPVSLTYLGVGSLSDRLEVGAAFAVVPDAIGECLDSSSGACTSKDWILVGPLFGYRYQPQNGGFFFHVGISLFLGLPDAPPVIPWPYVGFGGTL